MKVTRSFILTGLGAILLALMSLKGIDTSGPLTALITAYLTSRAATKASHVWASSKDPNADCVAMATKVEGLDK